MVRCQELTGNLHKPLILVRNQWTFSADNFLQDPVFSPNPMWSHPSMSCDNTQPRVVISVCGASSKQLSDMEALDVVTKPEWASGLNLSVYGRYYKGIMDDYEMGWRTDLKVITLTRHTISVQGQRQGRE